MVGLSRVRANDNGDVSYASRTSQPGCVQGGPGSIRADNGGADAAGEGARGRGGGPHGEERHAARGAHGQGRRAVDRRRPVLFCSARRRGGRGRGGRGSSVPLAAVRSLPGDIPAFSCRVGEGERRLSLSLSGALPAASLVADLWRLHMLSVSPTPPPTVVLACSPSIDDVSLSLLLPRLLQLRRPLAVCDCHASAPALLCIPTRSSAGSCRVQRLPAPYTWRWR